MAKLSVADLDVAGRRVLVRVDYNVPLAEGRIRDDARIRASLPTVRYLMERGARVILMSHLGRPKGRPVPELSLDPVRARLEELLGRPVGKVDDICGEQARQAAAALAEGEVLLLENLRFDPREEAGDPGFARELAALGERYVNDAFGAAHRAHASVAGVPRHLPAAAGFLLQREIEVLGKVLEDPDRPFAAILGGAKVSDKIGVIRNLLPRVDALLIGGGMAFTFLKARGAEVGNSLLDTERVGLAGELLAEAEALGKRVELPVDVVAADRFAADARRQVVPAAAIPAGWEGVDIGPRTREAFTRVLSGARTILWNGPLGVFELAPFAEGTNAVARAVAASGATTILGGGDTAAAAEQAGCADRMTHVSTGGGASLEFLEGKELPGVAALSDRA